MVPWLVQQLKLKKSFSDLIKMLELEENREKSRDRPMYSCIEKIL
jgi:hypothetical protein